MREFVRLADADGAHQRAETVHDDRRAHLSKVGDRWHLDAVCGPAQGVALKHIFDTYCQAAFDTDRAAAIARNGGGEITVEDLDRTSAQRAMDALHDVFMTAAAATPALRAPVPLVNVVIDLRTYDETVQWMATGTRPAKDLTTSPHGSVAPPMATTSHPPTPSPPSSKDRSATSSSTRRAPSSTSAANDGCSPATPATPSCSAPRPASGPDATDKPAMPNRPHHRLVRTRIDRRRQRGA